LILGHLGNGKKIALRVSGRSMNPLMREGDPIHIEKCDLRALSSGDIITFKTDDVYVTHRVLWVLKKGGTVRFITKGDNEITPDPPVSPHQILGKVVDLGRTDHIIHLERPSWRFINRFFGMIFLVEAVSILLYRFAAGKITPFRPFLHATFKPSDCYRRLKSRSLDFATRIIA
jgi:signal peptidase I